VGGAQKGAGERGQATWPAFSACVRSAAVRGEDGADRVPHGVERERSARERE
jgi:hypothetical protein